MRITIAAISARMVDFMTKFRHLFDYGKVIYEATAYGGSDLEIIDRTEEGESIRLLLVDGARESATFNKQGHRYDLVFKYSIYFNDVFEINPALKDCLLIGGAGFSYPKYLISRFPDKTLDVVEIDGEMVKLAFKYFYLEELYNDYNLYENNRLNIYVMDGHTYLATTPKNYDVIFNDAYISDIQDERLLASCTIELVKNRLNTDGIYVVNMITAAAGTGSYPLFEELALLRRYFKYVTLKRCRDDVPATERQNCLIFASDSPL